MVQLKIVLCPIDFSDLSRQELSIAVEVSHSFGSHLVLHHNLAAVSPGFTRAWEWNELHRGEQHSSDDAEARMRKILAEVPKTISVEGSISSGPLGTILLQLAEKLPADLVVLGSHGWSTPDHASVTERIIDQCPCPVLTIHEAANAAERFRLRPAAGSAAVPVLVPIDLSPASHQIAEYAFDLARHLPLQLHLLHILPAKGGHTEETVVLQRLLEIVPAELNDRTEYHIEHGDPIETILEVSERTSPAFLVMGEHARGFFRRFLTRDTARQVLHRAASPIWFIPARG